MDPEPLRIPDSLSFPDAISFARQKRVEVLLPRPQVAFSDARGAITNILSGIPIAHIALITSATGSVRGNHFHPADGGDQYIYVLSGAMHAFSSDPMDARLPRDPMDTRSSHARVLLVGAGDLLFCPVGVAHAYLCSAPTVFLAIDGQARGPDRYALTTHPFVILPWRELP